MHPVPPLAPSSVEPLARSRLAALRPLGFIVPIALLVWLSLGFVFKRHTAHFDWGFLWTIFWVASLPVVAVTALVFTGVDIWRLVKRRASASRLRLRLALWLAVLLLLAVVAALFWQVPAI
jgi:hypothetical protein